MDYETQLQFINAEIATCEARKTALEAIKDTISGLVAPEIASIPGLIEEKNTIVAQKDSEIQTLKDEKRELEERVAELEASAEEVLPEEEITP